ncbi:MAG: DNA primase [bacterium]|nr:DNA primase [bacterium]
MEPKGHIPKEQIDAIVESTDLVQLISGYTPLKASGQNFMGLCPFHQEKTPSFVVSPSRGSYHCFGCGVHGNAIGFLMDVEHFHFIEAVEYLADRAGYKLDRKGGGEAYKGFGEVRSCLDQTLEYFRNRLVQGGADSKVRRYLTQRELSLELADRFQLGWAPEGWTLLHDYLNLKGVEQKVQESAGLIKQGESGNWYDRLRDRLIFPIRDVQGRCLGFAGRILGDGEPKYLNPPETELYKKSSVFYGAFEARDEIRRSKKALLVEGYLDVIRLHEQGFKWAIAGCGTALNQEHVRALRRLGVTEVELLLDGDEAGKTAAAKAARLFVENDLDARVAVLPEGLDPDDFFKKYSSAQMTRLLEEAPRDHEYLLDRAYDEVRDKGLTQQANRASELVALSREIQSADKRDIFLNLVAKKFGVDRGRLTSRAQSAPKPARANLEAGIRLPQGIDLRQIEPSEKALICYLIEQHQALQTIRREVGTEELTNIYLRELFERIVSLEDVEYEQIHPFDMPRFFPEHSSVITQLQRSANRYSTESYSEDKLAKLIEEFHLGKTKQRLRAVKGSDAEREQVMAMMKQRKTKESGTA